MKEVQDSVETLAKTVSHEQRPAVYNEARGNFYFVKDGDRKFANTTPSTQTSNMNDIKRIVHVTGMVVENNKRIVQDWINEGSGWIEYKDDKIFTTYIEVERTFNSIILFDRSRKLFAKIVVSRSSDSVSIYWNPGELNSPPKEWWLLPVDYRVLR
jgi:hypothetical protein